MERTSIKVVCAALDERENEIILRGVIDADSLKYLQIADYQRDVSPQSKISSLMNAIRKGGVPDIQLGCRGGSFFERDDAVRDRRAHHFEQPVPRAGAVGGRSPHVEHAGHAAQDLE